MQSGFLNNLRPIHRFIISFIVAAIAYYFLPPTYNHLFKLLIAWISFSMTYIILCWIVIILLPVSRIKKNAGIEDGSKSFVFTMVLMASFASLLAVLILATQKHQNPEGILFIPIVISGMILSWILVHTVFIFHYAHLYYRNNIGGKGLNFPGYEAPDYIDFAYFSFVLGCTFQVSDVEISSRAIRRIALFHGILAFALNTFVLALTINIIAGLMG